MKSWPILIIVFISLFLIGCTQVDDSSIKEFKKEGFGELDVDRELSYFPRNVYQGSSFDVELSLINKAAYNAENVKVTLAGFDNSYVDIITHKEERESIAGRSIFDRNGESANFIFGGQVKDLQGKESELQNYFLYLNYDSTVEFISEPCIGTRQRYVGLQDNECVISEDPIRYSGQGAPLAVESMEVIPPSADGGKIEFRMKIRNRGKGEVNKIKLDKATISNEDLDCFFRGKSSETREIELSETDEAELICRKDLESQNRYTTTLFISLSYDYERVIKQSLELQR